MILQKCLASEKSGSLVVIKNTLSWANQSALFFDHQFILKESSDS